MSKNILKSELVKNSSKFSIKRVLIGVVSLSVILLIVCFIVVKKNWENSWRSSCDVASWTCAGGTVDPNKPKVEKAKQTNQFTPFTSSMRVLSVDAESKKVLAYTSGELYLIDGGTGKAVHTLSASGYVDPIFSSAAYSKNSFFFIANKMLLKVSSTGEILKSFAQSKKLEKESDFAVRVDPYDENFIWLRSNSGLFRLDVNTGDFQNIFKELEDKESKLYFQQIDFTPQGVWFTYVKQPSGTTTFARIAKKQNGTLQIQKYNDDLFRRKEGNDFYGISTSGSEVVVLSSSGEVVRLRDNFDNTKIQKSNFLPTEGPDTYFVLGGYAGGVVYASEYGRKRQMELPENENTKTTVKWVESIDESASDVGIHIFKDFQGGLWYLKPKSLEKLGQDGNGKSLVLPETKGFESFMGVSEDKAFFRTDYGIASEDQTTNEIKKWKTKSLSTPGYPESHLLRVAEEKLFVLIWTQPGDAGGGEISLVKIDLKTDEVEERDLAGDLLSPFGNVGLDVDSDGSVYVTQVLSGEVKYYKISKGSKDVSEVSGIPLQFKGTHFTELQNGYNPSVDFLERGDQKIFVDANFDTQKLNVKVQEKGSPEKTYSTELKQDIAENISEYRISENVNAVSFDVFDSNALWIATKERMLKLDLKTGDFKEYKYKTERSIRFSDKVGTTSTHVFVQTPEGVYVLEKKQ